MQQAVGNARNEMEFLTRASAWLIVRFPDDWNAGKLRVPTGEMN